MRDSAVATATAWEILYAALTIVVGQMKLTVALTHPILEVYFYLLYNTWAIMVIVIHI